MSGTQVINVEMNSDNTPPKAVVLLMGWWGAELRHVEKYAELYRNRGCATITVIADKIQVMTHLCYPSLDNCVREAVVQAAEIIRSHEENSKNGEKKKKIPVLTHGFSNAGTFLVERLEVLVEQAREDLKVPNCEELALIGNRLRGEIFDSSPAYPDYKLGFTSTNGTVFGQSIIAKLLVGFLFLCLGGLSLAFSILIGLPDVRWTFWNNMREGRSCLKQGYVYSTADTIINVNKLMELIENRKTFADVTVLKFDDSAHVQLMRKHPLEYEKFVDTFLYEIVEK